MSKNQEKLTIFFSKMVVLYSKSEFKTYLLKIFNCFFFLMKEKLKRKYKAESVLIQNTNKYIEYIQIIQNSLSQAGLTFMALTCLASQPDLKRQNQAVNMLKNIVKHGN